MVNQGAGVEVKGPDRRAQTRVEILLVLTCLVSAGASCIVLRITPDRYSHVLWWISALSIFPESLLIHFNCDGYRSLMAIANIFLLIFTVLFVMCCASLYSRFIREFPERVPALYFVAATFYLIRFMLIIFFSSMDNDQLIPGHIFPISASPLIIVLFPSISVVAMCNFLMAITHRYGR